VPVIAKQIAGILNTDDPNLNIHPSHHKMSKNVVFRGMNGNYRVEACKGNRKIANTLPAYDNKCIGHFYDQLKQRVFYFNYNSYGFNGIYMYDVIADTVSEVLVSFTDSQEDIFDFDPDYPIASANILYRTEEDGDVLLWTDRNNRPQGVNIKDALANYYSDQWESEYLTVAKKMPLIAATCEYKDDATVTINNLRKKLYQFRYRWVYRNLEKSTWSPWSKLFAPANPDDVANDVNPQKNNAIDVGVYTGEADIIKIEIAARQSLSTTFSDPFLVKTVEKDGGVYNNDIYTYRFYNDSSYPLIDLDESNLLYDLVPIKANTQELLNGNVVIYGGITEGYNFDETVDVDVTVDSVPFSDTGSLTFTFIQQDVYTQGYWDGTAAAGDFITFTATQRGNISYPDEIETVTVLTYTATGGESATDIRDYFIAQYNAAFGSTAITAMTIGGNPGWQTELAYPYPNSSSAEISIVYAGGSSGAVDGVANSIYKHKSRYGFGLVYFDQFGVTNGVVNTDVMLIETPEVTTTGDAATEIPRITFSINHQPPSWARYFSWVRSANLTFSNLISTVTAETELDGGTPNYAYLNITNLQTNETGLTAYSFSAGDRVRILGEYGASTVMSVVDFPVIELLEDPTINAVAKTGFWLKVPYNAALSGFGTDDNILIEIYTPAPNTTDTQLVYYEFGETYSVLNPGTGARCHSGMTQSQSLSPIQPAIYEFTRGDFYIKERKIPFAADLTNINEVWIIDGSVSDLFPSKINGNGRPFVVDEYAAQKYYPTLVRYSQAYQSNTNINQTNRFYPANYDEYDRARGDIQRLKVRGTNMRVFQSRAVGVVGVYREMLTNADGSTNLIQNDQIVNRINYYSEAYGMGNEFCGLASGSTRDYFVDPVIGAILRVSADGITNLTETFKGQFYISNLLTPYAKTWYAADGSKARILAAYDFFEEDAVFCLEAGDNGSTLAASETYGLTYLLEFSGNGVAGDVVTITVTSGGDTEVFTYTLVIGDTIASICLNIATLINNTSVLFSAGHGSNSVEISHGSDPINGDITITPGDVPEYTFSFNEKRNAFSSFFDYFPEWICNAQDKIVTWHDGEIWVHDTDYANFYGTQYDSSITLVFNDQVAVAKTFNTISYQANDVWTSSTTGDVNTSFINPQTNLQQESNLKTADYENTNGKYSAAFMNDANSRSTEAEGINNGDSLLGQWCEVKLSIEPSELKWVYLPAVTWQISNRNY
jgi:hypothetical protein